MSSEATSSLRSPLTSTELMRHVKGGSLVTLRLSQPIGARVAAIASRFGMSPDSLSLLNLLIATATGVGVFALLPESRLLAGVLALSGWQLAFAVDCADGQLARAQGRARPLGAFIDGLCDFGAHVVMAAVLGACALERIEQRWLVLGVIAAAACCVLLTYVTGLVAASFPEAPRGTRTGVFARLREVSSDYPVHLFAASMAIWLGGSVALMVLLLLAALQVAITVRVVLRLRADEQGEGREAR